MAKTYKVDKVINGTKYTAQFNGLLAALEIIDNSYIDNSSNISIEKLGEHILKNVIVSPAGLTANDFDNMDEYNAVVTFGREVMQGNFREKADKKSTETEGKE